MAQKAMTMSQPKPDRIFVWSVVWRFPHKAPPEGFPLVMLRVEQPRPAGAGAGPCPPEIHECWEEMREYGYCVQCSVGHQPARQLGEATKQRIRRRNLWKRLLKRYPMFLETYYQEAVEARPEYYGPYTSGEFADVVFARGRMGLLRMIREGKCGQSD